jgi:O-antigen ligase
MYLRPIAYRKQFYMFAVLGVLAFGYVAQDVFWERMNTLRAVVDEDQEVDSSAESRVVLAEAQWRMFLSYPHGSGHRGTAELSARYMDEKWLSAAPDGTPRARSSHNTLLSALVEQGIVGIFVFLGLILWFVRMMRAIKRHSKLDVPPDSRVVLYGAAAAACLAVVFVAGQFTDYIKSEVQIWMFATLAVLYHVHAELERTAQPKKSAPAANAPPQRSADPVQPRPRTQA